MPLLSRAHTHRFAIASLSLTLGLSVTLAGVGFAGPPVAVSDEFVVNSYTPQHQGYQEVAVLDDGSFVVVWESYGDPSTHDDDVVARLFSADGTAIGFDFLVNTYTTGNQRDPDVAVLTSGDFIVVWDSAGQNEPAGFRGIHGQRFDASGSRVGSELLIAETNAGDQNDAVVAAQTNNGWVVAWETEHQAGLYEEIDARRFDQNDDPIGGQFEVNVSSDYDQEDADIGSDSLGNFVVIWENDDFDGSGEAVLGRRFSATGTPLGASEFQVNTFTTGDQDDPSLAVHADGSFAVVWEDDAQDGHDAIFARSYQSDGTPMADPFQVDQFAGREMNPRVFTGPSGGLVITWDHCSDASSVTGPCDTESFVDVVVNTFDAAGAPSGPELLVNDVTDDDQLEPRIAVGPNGRGLVVWRTDSADFGSPDLWGRVIEVPLFVDGFESGDTADWSSTTGGL